MASLDQSHTIKNISRIIMYLIHTHTVRGFIKGRAPERFSPLGLTMQKKVFLTEKLSSKSFVCPPVKTHCPPVENVIETLDTVCQQHKVIVFYLCQQFKTESARHWSNKWTKTQYQNYLHCIANFCRALLISSQNNSFLATPNEC